MTGLPVGSKLRIPRPRPGLVERARLLERLRQGTTGRMTLISAPPGFGKSTLLAAWLVEAPAKGRTAAWLSLDATDNDPVIFWQNLTGALRQALAGLGIELPELLVSGQPTDSSLAAAIVNALADLPGPVDLVLDDFHVIDDAAIAAGMTYLIEHAPPGFHLVISTRADPALPLARMRAQGELVEIRSADLRFSGDEAAAYLNGVMHLGLHAADAARLRETTEGWIAALQLAALSIEGRADASEFIASFAGSNRYVVDYLVEEVLQRQPEPVRRFLLDTSILARLSGPLCDAVTGMSAGKATIASLERHNLFVIALDDRRQWYRYHHLFAEVLRAHLADEDPNRLPELHRRASDWFDGNGDRGEAISHALMAEDKVRAAELIELFIPEMQRNRREAAIRAWLDVLPADLVRNRPVLGIGFVGALVSRGEFSGIEDRLRDIERGLAALAKTDADPAAAPSDVTVIDRAQLPRLPGAVELYRAALAQFRGDIPGMIDHARRVLDIAPADDGLGRAAGSSLLGIAYWSKGDLDAARRFWSEGRNGLSEVGHVSDVLGVSIALADISLTQGRLGEATQVLEDALRLAGAESGPVKRGTADMHAGLCELCRERNALEAAHQHLQLSEELGELAGLPQHPYRRRVAAARLIQDEGQPNEAAALFAEAERVYVSDFFPLVRPVAAMRARALIAAGRFEEALRWQHAAGIDIDDDPSFLREFEQVTLARLLLALETQTRHPGPGGASALLERLLTSAHAGGRNGSVLEISILAAIANRADTDLSLAHLERALVLAAPEGYARIFLNEGRPMEALLKVAARRRVAPAYVRTLLAAFGPGEERAAVHPDLIEPLSDRELDVLRLLASDLGGPEIARELAISDNTVRTHTKNIYEKLGVNSRRAAVRRAEDLDLLRRGKSR